MLLIKDILISDSLFDTYFQCDLHRCKGACCWEGDYGAPLSDDEIESIDDILDIVIEILPEENKKVLKEKGSFEYYKEPEVNGTSLLKDASCAYLIRKGDEIGKCAFEILYNQGKTNFKKPISCELYPIRLIENIELNFFAMNYDEWDICKPACKLGKKNKLPVFRFLKNAIIRKFDEDFYNQLEAYYDHLQNK